MIVSRAPQEAAARIRHRLNAFIFCDVANDLDITTFEGASHCPSVLICPTLDWQSGGVHQKLPRIGQKRRMSWRSTRSLTL
jgi:hypothetical protein